MRVSYYPGCSLEGTAKSYDISVRHVCRSLDIQLEEVPTWACCGSSPALKMNRLLSTALSAHNLALAERQNLSDVVAPCPFCFRRLKSAQEEMARDPALRQKVEQTIESQVNGNLTIHNLLGFLTERVGMKAIGEKIRKPLTGLKLIPYYGCYVVKPPSVTCFDDPANPTSLDEILRAAGGEVLDWDFKSECCGAGLSLSKPEKVCELTGRLVRDAAWRGADAIVVVCQLCQANLDLRQREIGLTDKKEYQLPVIYFTELLGLAFGCASEQLGLDRHFVDPLAVLKRKGLA
ncbi:MAG: CoB--CoM heterodisulfide reductase iron-sulfur subunit B family protein [Desulfomonile tiedjei]|uniref:CoB--CoM heterodisulfide reductase iron-sulfur subunit B family protein n=1 Tax=Desulfomonile tiedjei TaxID=2358 RepID=A0A9D6Z226_9BACT|nr:CoB--CoM heterodisulfide reductase iron-sulfur subunit B family protein [Desulfomonile tiedjei]